MDKAREMGTTAFLKANDAGLDRAATLIAQGQLVAFPTETVYGLGGNARDGRAVAAIYAAKGRPSFNPLIVHVPSVADARDIAVWSDQAETLAAQFWPGPLTLVLPLKDGHGLSDLVTAGLPSVAIRVPASDLARDLLRQAGCPVAAPSANPSGKISPTTAAHVMTGLDGKIAAVLDGGACAVGLESTIIGLAAAPAYLRAGGISASEVETALGMPLAAPGPSITAPGQLVSHYAPSANVRLNASTWHSGELRLGFGATDCDLNLSAAGDLVEAAANLFGHLHKLDAMQGDQIAVSPIPMEGIGIAINDRLARAAAPRS